MKYNPVRFIVLLVIVSVWACNRNHSGNLPSVILILADDLGYGDLGCYGCTDIKTPNIDRLAKEGVMYTQFYANGPECTPTRAALLSGLYQQRIGGLECAIGAGNVGRYDEAMRLSDQKELGLPPEFAALPNRLKEKGYHTAIIGKWHLGYEEKFRPDKQGFDYSIGPLGYGGDYFYHVEQDSIRQPDFTGAHNLAKNGEEIFRDGEYMTELITAEAVNWLDQQSRGEPFFLYLPFTAPHSPYQGPGDDPGRPIEGEEWNIKSRKKYIEMTEAMDHGIGRILRTLSENKMDKETLVIFFSDNGGTRQADNGILSGFKGHLWEGGIRVPCIIRWPGRIKDNTMSDQVGIGFDLTRSILKFCGYPADSFPLDGYDLIGHIMEQREDFARTLFWRAKRGNSVKKAVRDGDDKYLIEVRNDSICLEKLFNLKEDVSETRNLLDALPRKADKLKNLLKKWEQQVSLYPQADAQTEGHKKFIYKQDTRQLYQLYSKEHLGKARRARKAMDSVIYNGPYKANYESLSLHRTPDWFRDAKFGIAVNYGIYSVAGAGEQGYGGNYYTDTYTNTMYGTLRSYHIENWGEDFERDDFIPLFNAKFLNAEKYVKLFKEAGAKYIAVFLNHRSTGMLLWDSDYTFRDSKDMPPHRDLAEEFRNACRRNKIPFCAYFNLEDTDYPLADPESNELYIREWTQIGSEQRADKNSYEVYHPYDPEKEERRLQGKIPVHDYVDDYLLPISKELIDNYEPDYIWFDGGWKRPAWYYKSHKMAAYYYNKYEGNKEVLVNCRLGADLYGKLGDVVISEGGSSDEAIQTGYWEEITPMGRNFAFDRWETDENVPSSTDLIHMLIRIVAGGGNLLLIVAPDGQGQIPGYQLKRLHEIGRWLEINGEAVYRTVEHPVCCEEDKFGYRTYYTRSRNRRYTYALASKLGRNRKILYKAKAKEGTDVKLLGYENNLEWFNSDWGLNILLPEDVLDHLPCSHAWVFRFEEETTK